ncbi:MAG: hypothetical protein EBQ89_03370, partial [Alphaproteobacteria bacterium]|nr:hypothetical protein [Alphaproteobacteria bacterium]
DAPDLTAGTLVVTSGDGGIFPPDMVVGTVVPHKGKWMINPAVNGHALDYVLLKKPWQPPATP